MMAVVFAAACILGVGILWICLLLGSYAICEALDSMEEVYEK